jgi:hypothetical protein
VNEHTFIIRIWAESREIEGAPPEYRGMIKHASSGEKRHLEDMDSIPTFIVPYMKEMGVNVSRLWQLKQWLRQQKKLLTP